MTTTDDLIAETADKYGVTPVTLRYTAVIEVTAVPKAASIDDTLDVARKTWDDYLAYSFNPLEGDAWKSTITATVTVAE